MSETPVRGWFWATSPKATIGIEVAEGKIVDVAPYGYKWLYARPIEDAIKLLERRGWTVKRGDSGV